MYMWLQQQCTECETIEEYERSMAELHEFLEREDTKKVLSPECIKAMIELQLSVQTKIAKLGGFRRMDRKNCMDAMTTSPAESNNNAIKHSTTTANSRKNIDGMMSDVVRGINSRLHRRRNEALRELGQNNTSSRAPTMKYITRKGQAIADQNFDNCCRKKSAQLSETEFITWNFDVVDEEELANGDCISDLHFGEMFIFYREHFHNDLLHFL